MKRLYIFRGPHALKGYHDGIAFAVASSKKQAVARIKSTFVKEYGEANAARLERDLEAVKPDITEVAGFQYGSD